jgi:hypothetical protein
MTSYVLYKFRYRQGNFPPEQAFVEIADTGKEATNRDSAERLARQWVQERAERLERPNLRFIDAEPFVAISERPTELAAPQKAKPIAATA